MMENTFCIFQSILNARSKVPLEEIAVKVREENVETVTLVGDAAVAENSRQMVSAAINIGEFLGFIHNAGVSNPGPLLHEIAEPSYGQPEGILHLCKIAPHQTLRGVADGFPTILQP